MATSTRGVQPHSLDHSRSRRSFLRTASAVSVLGVSGAAAAAAMEAQEHFLSTNALEIARLFDQCDDEDKRVARKVIEYFAGRTAS